MKKLARIDYLLITLIILTVITAPILIFGT